MLRVDLHSLFVCVLVVCCVYPLLFDVYVCLSFVVAGDCAMLLFVFDCRVSLSLCIDCCGSLFVVGLCVV